MMYQLFSERPSLFREARLVHFAQNGGGAEQPGQQPEGEKPLDTKMRLDNPEAIDAAKRVRITTADDALVGIGDATQASLKNIATLEFNELKGDKTEQADLEKAAQTVQDRFSHADIHATFVVNADKSVTWDFQPLEAKDSDFDVSIPAELRQKMKDVINSASPGTELVFKEFVKGATMESLNALVNLQDSEASRKGITYALNSMDWSGTKESVDASIAAVPDAQQRAAITAFREAFGDAKIAQLQSSVKRVGAEKPEENVLANPRQQEALDKRLSVNISKMKDYEVMRIQGQIMQNFGVNVNVEGEGDSRKLVAEPYNPESAKLIKFMGMVTIVMSWVAQLREMKDRMEGKSTDAAKPKTGEAPAPGAPPGPNVPGGGPETPAPAEAPEVGAKKNGAKILEKARAKAEGEAYVLDLKEYDDAKFTFDAGRWKVEFPGIAAADVEGLVYNDKGGTDAQNAEMVILNKLFKELGDLNKEATDKGVEKTNAQTVLDQTKLKVDKFLSPKVQNELAKLGMTMPEGITKAGDALKALGDAIRDNRTGAQLESAVTAVRTAGEQVDVMRAEMVKQMGDAFARSLSGSDIRVTPIIDGHDFNISSFWNLQAGLSHRDPDIAVHINPTTKQWEWRFTSATAATQHEWTPTDVVVEADDEEPKDIVKRLDEINKLFR